MSYKFDPRGALEQVCLAAAQSDHFPPPCAGRAVTDAIEILKAHGADPQHVAIAEGLSILLYRLEVSSWTKDPDEARRVRDSIAAQIVELPALVDYEPIRPECSVLELSTGASVSRSLDPTCPPLSHDGSHLSTRSAPWALNKAPRSSASIGGPDCY